MLQHVLHVHMVTASNVIAVLTDIVQVQGRYLVVHIVGGKLHSMQWPFL